MADLINLEGKTAVVFGLANKRSIAWGIAQKLHEGGAKLAIQCRRARAYSLTRGRWRHLATARRR